MQSAEFNAIQCNLHVLCNMQNTIQMQIQSCKLGLAEYKAIQSVCIMQSAEYNANANTLPVFNLLSHMQSESQAQAQRPVFFVKIQFADS